MENYQNQSDKKSYPLETLKITKKELKDYVLIRANNYQKALNLDFLWQKYEDIKLGSGQPLNCGGYKTTREYGTCGRTDRFVVYYYFGKGRFRLDFTGFFLARYKNSSTIPLSWRYDETNIFDDYKFRIAEDYYNFLVDIQKKIKLADD